MLRSLLCILLATSAAPAAPAAVVVKVDLGPDNGRNDAVAAGMLDWRFKPGRAFDARGGVSLRLDHDADDDNAPADAAADDALKPTAWKGGYDHPARMASDGVIAAAATGGVRLTIAGLSPGRHAVSTFHNAVERELGPCVVSVGDRAVKVQPTYRVLHDADAASAHFEFDVGEDRKPVTLRIAPATENQPVVLNGLWIDSPDPASQAIKPSPEPGDWHAAESPLLSWTPPKGATAHRLYFGSDERAVAAADEKSPEYQGALERPSFQTRALRVQSTYFWRVDEVTPAGVVTRGEVWSFKVRLLAFPGAEGYGRFAQGGRGGKVYEVTTLADYAEGEAPIAGSYRAAIEADGPRTIVFRVSGVIWLKRPCTIKNGFVTVAGQTAPGDGVCLANYSAGMTTTDAVVRFLRVRVGDKSRKAMDGLGLGSSNHSIIDHCSISWTMDEGTSSRGGRDVTFQWNVISESLQHAYHYNAADRTKLETHAFAGSISGDIGSYHHNLLAHNTDRNWSLAGGLNQSAKYAGRLDVRNNVVYNWTNRTTDGGVAALNYVNNYYKPYAKQPRYVKWLLKLDPINPDWGAPKYFMNGNVMEGHGEFDADNWRAFTNGKDVERQVRVDQPLFPSYVKEESAREAYARVLDGAGATLPRRDVIDRRIVDEVRNGTVHYQGKKAAECGPGDKNAPNVPGIIDTQDDVKDADDSPMRPWPHYRTYDVPADADHDGMPDAWEAKRGLNPRDPADGNADPVGDGYTNLERYLNELAEAAWGKR